MLTRIHHVGVVVPSLEEGLKFWRDTLGMRLTKSATIEEQGVRAALLEIGGSEVELLEPLSPEGGVGKFLARRAAGCITYASKPTTLRASLQTPRPRGSS